MEILAGRNLSLLFVVADRRLLAGEEVAFSEGLSIVCNTALSHRFANRRSWAGLGSRFIFGPVGGGESMPSQLRRGVPLAGRMTETLRELGNALTSYDPMMLYTFSKATVSRALRLIR